jgi:two-component system chemotaxis sensor kinase CheA
VDLSKFLDLFVAESREHLAAADALVRALGEGSGEAGALQELFRHVHSLKGMAASMGYPSLASLAHAAEDLMDAVRSGERHATPFLSVVLLDALSCMEEMVDAAEAKAPVEHPRAEPLEASLRAAIRGDEPTAPSPARGAAGVPASGSAPVEAALPAWRVDLKLVQDPSLPAVGAAAVLGRLAKIGRIQRSDPPMAALRTGRFDGKLSAVLSTSLSPTALAREVARIDEVESFQLLPATFEAPAPAGPKAPASWVRVRADLLDALVEETLELMLEQGRLSASVDSGRLDEARPRTARCQLHVRKLYGDLMELRLVPFETVAHRLLRGVGDLSRSLGKQARFEITGREVRIDRSLLDGLVDPLLHLIRNALDHGIEPPAERASAGKPPEGSVCLHLTRERDRVRIVVEDDGRGLVPQALRKAAVARGLLSAAEVERLTDSEALLLTTLPGFSTAKSVGAVSGRGVGMDVVRTAVESFGGRLVLDSSPGRGTRVVLSLPMAAAVIHALMVRSAGQVYAVPVSSLERTARVDEESIVRRDGKSTLPTPEGVLELFYLDERLGLGQERPKATAPRSALVYPAGGRTVGLVVDEVLGRREILVKPLLPPLDVLRAYEGAALLQDGSVALVLDPVNLVSI